MSDAVTTSAIKRNPLFRSTQTVPMVRVEKRRTGEEIVIKADLPVGRGWGSGTILDYVNRGWMPESEYEAKKHSAEVALKREADAKKGAK